MAGAATALAAEAELRAAHLSATANQAQLTLDIAGNPSQKMFTLEKPRRTVIDLPHTHLARGFHLPHGTGMVSDIRVGHQLGGTIRVVVELREQAPARGTWEPSRDGAEARDDAEASETSTRTVRQLIVNFGNVVPESESAPRVVRTAHAPVDSDRDVNRVVRAAHAPLDSDRDVIVAVDAGHGGQDPGAIGRGGTREKDVVLAIARSLAARINSEPGMRAVLTRNRDEFLVLRDRIRRARVAKADMFISVHADSIANRDVSGASVYVLSERGASNESARWLAERENAADLMGGVSLDDKDNTLASVLLDLSQSANISASMTAAQRVLSALDGVGQVRKSQVQQAGFVVLKSPDIPSMLVETAYISNPVEEQRLRAPRHQASLADAIFSGVRGYFEQNPPVGTRFAQTRRSNVASVASAAPSP